MSDQVCKYEAELAKTSKILQDHIGIAVGLLQVAESVRMVCGENDLAMTMSERLSSKLADAREENNDKCGGCDSQIEVCQDCGFCVTCALESLHQGEGFCVSCVERLVAHLGQLNDAWALEVDNLNERLRVEIEATKATYEAMVEARKVAQ